MCDHLIQLCLRVYVDADAVVLQELLRCVVSLGDETMHILFAVFLRQHATAWSHENHELLLSRYSRRGCSLSLRAILRSRDP